MFAFFKRRRERQRLVATDADALMANLGPAAYYEARSRAFEARRRAIIDGNRPDQHWDLVRRIIGRRTGHDGLDTATRYLTRK